MKVTLDENKLNATIKEQNLTLKSPVGIVPHGNTHKSGGSDVIKLDELGEPSDNTNLNVSTERHGLAPKLPGDSNKFLNGTGNWSVIEIPSLDWDSITGKPSVFPPETHTHTKSQITDFEVSWSEIANKPSQYPPQTHSHTKSEISDFSVSWSEIVGKPSEFPPSQHNHNQAEILNLESVLDEIRRQSYFYGVR